MIIIKSDKIQVINWNEYAQNDDEAIAIEY